MLELSGDPGNPIAEELDELFHRMQTIAVIGLSRDPAKTARRVPSYLAAKGYDVIPVNPYTDRILGRDAYATITDVPEAVDLVVIFRPSDQVGPFVTETAQRPERPVIWLQEGIWAESEIEAARESGLKAVQNMCTYRVHRALSGAEASSQPPAARG